MKEIPQISDAEWEVMRVLWEHSPATANEIIEKLNGQVSWKPKTIKTLLNRLLNKKAIDFERNERSYCYYPIITRDECVREESKSFLERVYGGALNVMFANFLSEHRLSKDDIDELKKILDQHKE